MDWNELDKHYNNNDQKKVVEWMKHLGWTFGPNTGFIDGWQVLAHKGVDQKVMDILFMNTQNILEDAQKDANGASIRRSEIFRITGVLLAEEAYEQFALWLKHCKDYDAKLAEALLKSVPEMFAQQRLSHDQYQAVFDACAQHSIDVNMGAFIYCASRQSNINAVEYTLDTSPQDDKMLFALFLVSQRVGHLKDKMDAIARMSIKKSGITLTQVLDHYCQNEYALEYLKDTNLFSADYPYRKKDGVYNGVVSKFEKDRITCERTEILFELFDEDYDDRHHPMLVEILSGVTGDRSQPNLKARVEQHAINANINMVNAPSKKASKV